MQVVRVGGALVVYGLAVDAVVRQLDGLAVLVGAVAGEARLEEAVEESLRVFLEDEKGGLGVELGRRVLIHQCVLDGDPGDQNFFVALHVLAAV